MALIRWEPFSRAMIPWDGFETLRRRMDRLFDDYSRGDSSEPSRWWPQVDVSEAPEQFILHAEIPGMDKKDIKITLQDNVLTLSGEKKLEREDKERNYHLLERSHGQFSRSFTLPSKVDDGKIKASFRNGVLEIELPKAPQAKTREIEIQAK